LAVWLFGFVCFWAQMKRIYCKEKKHNWASKAHHQGAIGILTPNNLKAKIARLWVII
jgi:hypothetical protein